jgi:hypothetical protein
MTDSAEELLEGVLHCYRKTYAIDDFQLAISRERVGRYLANLESAGHRDPRDLAAYAEAYLKELREGPDPERTGC